MYSKKSIDRAGLLLAQSKNPYSETDAAAAVNYWRSLHRIPLSWLLHEASSRLAEQDDILIVGRIKKFDTIVDKLKRPNTPNKLKTMYDIAGCRVVVEDLKALHTTVDILSEIPGFDESKSNKRDYIARPKADGDHRPPRGILCSGIVFRGGGEFG